MSLLEAEELFFDAYERQRRMGEGSTRKDEQGSPTRCSSPSRLYRPIAECIPQWRIVA